MSTIQIVMQDFEYARRLETQFSGDGHTVTVRNSPDLSLGGVIVLDSGWIDRVDLGNRPERLVVITSRNASINLADMWGGRHSAFGVPGRSNRKRPLGYPCGD